MQIIFPRTNIFSSGCFTMSVWHIHMVSYAGSSITLTETHQRNEESTLQGGKSITNTQNFFLHMHLRFPAAAVLNTYMPLRVRGYGDLGCFLLSPTSEGNQLEVEGQGPEGQQLVIQLALTRGL